MASEMLSNALRIVHGYLYDLIKREDLREKVYHEIDILTGCKERFRQENTECYTYDQVQEALRRLNEKESIRKDKGVYYTPSDIVDFILTNCVKLACVQLSPDSFSDMDLSDTSYLDFYCKKTVFDPTCGTGEFLLAALEKKLSMFAQHRAFIDMHHPNYVQAIQPRIEQIVATIKGNDLNEDSIVITKLRLFLCVLHRYGVESVEGIAAILNNGFTSYDYLSEKQDIYDSYDIIIGNPPYVEDGKSDSAAEKKYGNIYANVLEKAALQLKWGGVMGFIVPLSYVSTPRMKKIRSVLSRSVTVQYILSFSDRPDCLFPSVHQKLCILFGRRNQRNHTVYTGNYRYWYREERRELFNDIEVVENPFVAEGYIPKLGNSLDVSIYKKLAAKHTPLSMLLQGGKSPVYLNMRAAFWIKAFLNEHKGAEYKVFGCQDESHAKFAMCLLNSSLFWWYWICVSDCWHITRKELEEFKVPELRSFEETDRLADTLEKRLEETKVYVGTKQTEYEYKHRACVDEIHEIDDYINALYGLTKNESLYIKNFAYRYRVSGGVKDACN